MNENPFEKFNKPSDYLLPDEKEGVYLRRIQKRITEPTQVKNILPIKWVIGIAAVLLILPTIYLLQPADNLQLAENNFSPYKSYVEEQTRGDFDIGEAYRAYNEENFSAAVMAFENDRQLSKLDSFYLAIAFQAQGEWQSAYSILIKLDQTLPMVHQDAYFWFLSLSHLALGNTKEANELLDKIIQNGDSQFVRKAQKLTQKLK